MQPLHLETPTSENNKNKIHNHNHNEHNKNQEKPKDLFLIQNKIIFKKYHPIKQIGRGTFSTVYLAIIVNTKKYVAIKAEKKTQNSVELLKAEAFLLYSLRGFGIPEVISYGKTKYYNILVMPLLGKSLLDMFILRPSSININDICISSLQILDRIEWVHVNNVVYRDIKPENFLFGKNDNDVLYLIDFGLCRKYRSSKTGQHISPKNLGKFTGTSRYASVYAMAGNEQSRRDDIESIGYMIIYFMKKKLPWQGIRGNSYKECYHKLFLMKKHMDLEILCRGLPKEVLEYMKYAKNLKFEQEPNYKYLKNLFQNILNKNKINIDNYILSWRRDDNNQTLKKDHSTIIKNNPINTINHNNKTQKLQRKTSPPNKIYKKIKESLDDKNKSHNYSINNLQNYNLNSTMNKNEMNSEISDTMKVLMSKNLQIVNNSNQNQSAGVNLNLARINSEKNVYSDNFFIQGMNSQLKGYNQQNYKIGQMMSFNQQLTERNNINSGEKYNNNNHYSNYINNNMNNTKTKKIISIIPLKQTNGNIQNNNIIHNTNNNRNRYNKITQIKITEVNKENNNNNKNGSKENIIYNTYNTYNTYNSYNNINNINTPMNNNSYLNSIYKREPPQIINYQNYNRIKKNNIQNNHLLNYIKSESFIEENKNNNNNKTILINNNYNNKILKNNYSSLDINNKPNSITEHFHYNNYQNKKLMNSYNNINNIRKSNTALNKNRIISITPVINSKTSLDKKNNIDKIHHYNSYVIKDINSYNYSNYNNYQNNGNNSHGKNNFLKITKHSNKKYIQNINNKKNSINENRSMNITNNYTNRITSNFTSIKNIKSNQHNKTLDNNSYYINSNKYPITKNQSINSYINKNRQESNRNQNQKNSTQVLNNKRSNKLIFSKMEPSLPNHSIKIVKESSKTKNKENNSKEINSNNGNKNRINKYKILRNRNAQNH